MSMELLRTAIPVTLIGMPRGPAPTQTDREIADRLKAFREKGGWSQTEFVQGLDMTRDQLASVESGRTRLQYSHAFQFRNHHLINLWWLATGQGDPNQFQCGTFPKPEHSGFGQAASLHQVAMAVKARENAASKKMLALVRNLPAYLLNRNLTAEEREHLLREHALMRQELLALIAGAYDRASSIQQIELVDRLHLAVKQFDAEYPGVVNFKAAETALDEFAENSKCEDVRRITLKGLLNRVRQLTDVRGKRSELARVLGVSPSLVTAWLAGKFQPSGEVTLNLLTWVEEEEARQKSTGSAQTPSVPQTQLRKTRERKPKPGPSRKR